MKLLTKELEKKLTKNHKMSLEGHNTSNLKPLLKLFAPWGAATWLITEYDPYHNTFFGLCDLGMGFPELGEVSREELESLQGPLGLKIERDIHFVPDKTLTEYAEEASALGRINA
jgi:hypothetical protein